MNDEYAGIIIRYREYREHDAMLRILIEDGRILSVIARGIQKIKSKNASACQLFTQSRILLNMHENSDLHTLKSAEIIDSYRTLREDLYKQSIASYMCECLDNSDFDEDVYPLLRNSLDIMKDTKHPLRILCLFQSIVNRKHGIEPYVDGCVRCENTAGIQGISIYSGGMICKSCFRAGGDHKKSTEELKRFRLLCKAELQHYDILKDYPDFYFDDFMTLYDFFAEYAGVNVRSIRFLKHLYTMGENC